MNPTNVDEVPLEIGPEPTLDDLIKLVSVLNTKISVLIETRDNVKKQLKKKINDL